MKLNRSTRKLREHPDLDQLKRQAKELLQAFLAGDAAAAAEVHTFYHDADPATFALHDAQLVLARAHGFDSWPKLKSHVDGLNVQRLAEFVRAGDLAQVQAMLQSRPELADMQMTYGDEHRPLHFAVMNRSPEIVRVLMQHGADARAGIHPHRGATKAHTIATERGFDDIVAIIEAEEQRRREIATPSEPTVACKPRRAQQVQLDADSLRAQHAAGTLTNPIDWGSGGLLTAAVMQNRPDILELLLSFGFDPDERVSSGEGPSLAYSQTFPLWHCAALGRREMAEILLRYGASLNEHVDSSGSPVYSAFSHRQWDMVDLFLKHGGVVGADTAAIYRQTDLARKMLDDDARGIALPAGVVTPNRSLAEDLLDFACSGGDPEIVRMALERIAWPHDDRRWFFYLARSLDFWNHIPWLYAANSELDRDTYIECFRHVLGRCDPNVVGGFGRTALHEVAAIGDHVTDDEAAPFAIALLDAGARTDFRDDLLKSTPLGWACRWGRVSVAKALLDRGADPIEADAEPWARPRAWAEKMGHAEVLAILPPIA